MKLIKYRNKIDSAMLSAALMISALPAIGLLSGTAISFGLYGNNYQEISLVEDPEGYWFTIKLELTVIASMIFLSKFDFPLFAYTYEKLLKFRRENIIFSYFLLYLVVPIFVVSLIIFLMVLL